MDFITLHSNGYYSNGRIYTKQRVSLSQYAHIVIQQDIASFKTALAAPNATISTIVNHIFANYREDAEASVTQRLNAKRREYENILGECRHNEPHIDALVKHYKRYLLNKIETYQNEHSSFTCTISLNKDNYYFLTDQTDGYEEFYKSGKVGYYLKTLIEEYCGLPYVERELIILKASVVNPIHAALGSRKMLKVRTTGDNTEFCYVKPLGIYQDSDRRYNYLAGLVAPNAHAHERDWNPYCIRLSNIQSCIQMGYSGTVPGTIRKGIEKAIREKGVQYLSESTPTPIIKVKLTPYGEKLYNSVILNQRPWYIHKDSDSRVYTFNCTEIQALYYFERFGKEAIILEPQHLVMVIHKWYNDACKHYTLAIGKDGLADKVPANR